MKPALTVGLDDRLPVLGSGVDEPVEGIASSIVDEDVRFAFTEIYVPALKAKELALALETHVRSAADPAL